MFRVVLFCVFLLIWSGISIGASQPCHWRCWQYPDGKVYCWCYPVNQQRQVKQRRQSSYPERVAKSVVDNAVRTAVSELNWFISDAIRSVRR